MGAKAAKLKRFASSAGHDAAPAKLPKGKKEAPPVKKATHAAAVKAVKAAGHEVDEVLEQCCPSLSAKDTPDDKLLKKLRKSVVGLGDKGSKIKEAAKELDAEGAQRAAGLLEDEGVTEDASRLATWLLMVGAMARAEAKGKSKEAA